VEGIVGFPICDRNSRQVVFTEAGNELTCELRQAKQHIKLGIHRGQIAHAGKEHFLLVGHCPFIDPQLLSLVFQIRLPQFPKLRVETTTDVAPILTQKLLDGVLNMAIVARPMQTETILYTLLSEAPLYAVMPAHHPAASKGSVSLADFAEDCWVVFRAGSANSDRGLSGGSVLWQPKMADFRELICRRRAHRQFIVKPEPSGRHRRLPLQCAKCALCAYYMTLAAWTRGAMSAPS
jgi:DNA-binding transcriptional LysR family regulator